MHLSILCPTTPLPGYRGEKVGHLTCFDTKLAPYVGNLTAHHMHVLYNLCPGRMRLSVHRKNELGSREWSEGESEGDMLCQFPSLEAISVQCTLHDLPELVNYLVFLWYNFKIQSDRDWSVNWWGVRSLPIPYLGMAPCMSSEIP